MYAQQPPVELLHQSEEGEALTRANEIKMAGKALTSYNNA